MYLGVFEGGFLFNFINFMINFFLIWRLYFLEFGVYVYVYDYFKGIGIVGGNFNEFDY